MQVLTELTVLTLGEVLSCQHWKPEVATLEREVTGNTEPSCLQVET